MDSTNIAGRYICKGMQGVAWYFEVGSRSIMQILQWSSRYQLAYKINLFDVGLGAPHGHPILHMVHRKLVNAFRRTVNLNFLSPGQWLEFQPQGH